jgi:soluble lytic murein transglycosylase-like protein
MGDVLGLRLGDRRHDDRRHLGRGSRSTGERRKARRRRTARSLAFGLFAMALPNAGASTKLANLPVTVAAVSVSENFRALPANIAYNDFIAEAARLYTLDPDLIRAIIRAESAFNPFAVSSAGAQGLMQLMPDVAAELEVFDPFDARQNILGGARYLRWLLDRHHGNLDLAVASYNAGPGAVDRFKGIPPYRETRAYVRKVNLFLKTSKRTSDGD